MLSLIGLELGYGTAPSAKAGPGTHEEEQNWFAVFKTCDGDLQGPLPS